MTNTMADSCTHLTAKQREDLYNLFKKFELLFDGKLCKYTDEQIHLDVDSTVTPHQSCAYTVPHLHKTTFKKELNQLVKIGVLKKCGRASLVSGTFIIPKTDGSV